MDPTIVIALSELIKLGMSGYIAYAKQQGLNDEQIDNLFQQAMNDLFARDPNKIPD